MELDFAEDVSAVEMSVLQDTCIPSDYWQKSAYTAEWKRLLAREVCVTCSSFVDRISDPNSAFVSSWHYQT